MARTQQTFRNDRDVPIYVSVEPWPEAFELEPGDRVTLVYDANESGDAVQVNFVNEKELVIYPNEKIDQIEILFNGSPSNGRSWAFKHR